MSSVSPVSPAVGHAAIANDLVPGSQARSAYEALIFRDGRLRPCHTDLSIATWNVEGLTGVKLVELQWHMKRLEIDILCIQETHKSGS